MQKNRSPKHDFTSGSMQFVPEIPCFRHRGCGTLAHFTDLSICCSALCLGACWAVVRVPDQRQRPPCKHTSVFVGNKFVWYSWFILTDPIPRILVKLVHQGGATSQMGVACQSGRGCHPSGVTIHGGGVTGEKNLNIKRWKRRTCLRTTRATRVRRPTGCARGSSAGCPSRSASGSSPAPANQRHGIRKGHETDIVSTGAFLLLLWNIRRRVQTRRKSWTDENFHAGTPNIKNSSHAAQKCVPTLLIPGACPICLFVIPTFFVALSFGSECLDDI